ncbi:MAG: hypothetical protein HY927_13850 [Elusimicrobia bacterium]|nr:hypothetical protein [Elusimicrobiota bacterium]
MTRRWAVAAAVLWTALGAPRPSRASGPGAGEPAYSSGSGLFTCQVPPGWHAFEETEPTGSAVHLLGPDDPAGVYRAGLDIHFVDGSLARAQPMKAAIEFLRRQDKLAQRQSTQVKRVSSGRGLARVFEVWETLFLPPDLAPSVEARVHHYVAVIESGSDYFVIRLSSSEEVYLDFRDDFLRLVKTFRVKGG